MSGFPSWYDTKPYTDQTLQNDLTNLKLIIHFTSEATFCLLLTLIVKVKGETGSLMGVPV